MSAKKASNTIVPKPVKGSKGKVGINIATTSSKNSNNDDDVSDNDEDENEKYPWKKEGDKESMIQLLKDKCREVEKLKVLIESLEPIPGMDPEKYNQFVFNGIDDAFDFRDTKIISLAKKVRNLSMKTNKFNAINEANKKEIIVLRNQYDELKSTHDTILAKEQELEKAIKPETEKRLQKELSIANKTIDELKRRQQQLNDEVKNLQRALRSELGSENSNTSLDQVVLDPSWKGRADQVTMLKIRLKKYETGMIGTSTIDNNRNSCVTMKGGGTATGVSSDTSRVLEGRFITTCIACYRYSFY